MSVMTPEQLRNAPRRGLPIEQAPMPPPQLQRQAVIDQLGTPPAAGPVASNPGTFARGGQVKQLPGSGVGGKLADIGIGVGTQIAGKQLGQSAAQAAVGGAAQSGLKSALTSGAGGAAAGMGIGIGTGLLANKIRDKEDMPVFGGANAAYLDDKGRRFQGTGGGIASNAVKYAGVGANPALIAATGGLSVAAGAIGGAIKGAITKHAKSAYTDFRVEDGAQAIKDLYKKELGREASDDEVQTHLVNQGWDPTGGDRWVGEKGINSVLDSVRASPEAQAFRTRGSVVDQLGSGAAEPVASTDVQARTAGEAAGVPNIGQSAATTSENVADGAPVDQSGWNTDGYGAPAFSTPVAGDPPPGISVDPKKWKDPNHQTPKYVWLRIAAANPGDPKAQVDQLLKAYPGAQFNGKDKVTGIPGLGPIDIFRGASVGENAPQWYDINAAEGGGAAGAQPAPNGARAPGSIDLSRGAPQPDVMESDTLARLKAQLDRIMAGTPDREALIAQMGGSNG